MAQWPYWFRNEDEGGHMTETIEKTSGVSRRTFLKGSSLAALAGVGGSALYGCSAPEERSEERRVGKECRL